MFGKSGYSQYLTYHAAAFWTLPGSIFSSSIQSGPTHNLMTHPCSWWLLFWWSGSTEKQYFREKVSSLRIFPESGWKPRDIDGTRERYRQSLLIFRWRFSRRYSRWIWEIRHRFELYSESHAVIDSDFELFKISINSIRFDMVRRQAYKSGLICIYTASEIHTLACW